MNGQGNIFPKNIKFDDEGRELLLSGVKKLSKAVKSTMGYAGQVVLIESPNHTHGLTASKDGVTVAKSIDLLDPVENLGVRIVKEAAERTVTDAGDGTTSSIVLSEALIEAGLKHITSDVNKTEVLRDLVEKTNDIVDGLKKNSKAVTKGKLKDVATISANNDKAIGKTIADVYKEVGSQGTVKVEQSPSDETYTQSTQGLKIDRGYSTNLFVNDHERDECVMSDVRVLVCDGEISNIMQIEHLLGGTLNGAMRLLIIAPVSNNILRTLASNVVKQGMKVCVITPPSFGYKQNELMGDIALSVGAKYFSEKTGDDLSLIELGDLGYADKVIVGGESTIVFKSKAEDSEELLERVAQLTIARDNSKKKADKDFISSRIASLTGGVGVIYSGGNTDLERKELFDRIEDAVCAVRSAQEEGIVAGGGYALYKQAMAFANDESVAGKILFQALKAPCLQILDNAGLDRIPSGVDFMNGEVYDLKNMEVGDAYQLGLIDPLKVIRCSLQNAMSVAVTLLSTNAVITMARSIEEGNQS